MGHTAIWIDVTVPCVAFVSAFFFGRFLTAPAWLRKLRGGHWELVDFDKTISPFSGKKWLRMDRCTREVLKCEVYGETVALVCCEEYRRSEQIGG